MSLVEPPAASSPAAPVGPDLLREGMRMNRPEFHRRYMAISEEEPDFRAELIGGVVYLRDPMGTGNPHATFHELVMGWLWEYRKRTPGVAAKVTPTVLLDDLGEPEPDAVLKRAAPGEDATGFLAGPQRFVAEVSVSTLRKDLGVKFRDYQRAGVPEYVVFDVEGRRVHWFVRGADGAFAPVEPENGLYRSREFPGLWLDAAAFFAEDAAGIEAAVAKGVADRDAAG